MPLTATKLPDGEMYLQEENPHVRFTPIEQIKYQLTNEEYNEFASEHPPILALFKCIDGQRFEDGEVELVDQFQGHKDWHTCQNITPEMAKENNWPTRRVYTFKSEPMTPDEIKYQGLSMANNNWNYISKLIYDGWQVGSHRKTYSAVRALPTHTLKSDKGGDVVKGKKEFQLTPGPWKTTLIMGVAAAVVTDNRKEHTICDCSQSIRISDKEKSANAQLIAAAPELLEACIKLREFIDDVTPSCAGGDDQLYYVKHLATAAINKAINPPQP